MDTEHHVDIVSALRNKDVDKAIRYLEEDIQDFGEYSAYRLKTSFFLSRYRKEICGFYNEKEIYL